MKKQEILDLLGLPELPAAGQPGREKCAALVQRTTGVQDYVITKNRGVITDIGYKSAIVRIVEYYPVVKTEPTPPTTAPEKEKPTPVKEPVQPKFDPYFLKKKKSEKPLHELLGGVKKPTTH